MPVTFVLGCFLSWFFFSPSNVSWRGRQEWRFLIRRKNSVIDRSKATAAVGKSSCWDSRMSTTTHSTTSVVAFGTTTPPASNTTPSTGGRRRRRSSIGVVTNITTGLCPPRANSDGDPLQHPAVVMASRVHAIVDREVAADQVRAHGGVFLRHLLRLADGVGLVFAVVDAHDAGVPCGTRVGFVERVWPAATAAETWKPLSYPLIYLLIMEPQIESSMEMEMRLGGRPRSKQMRRGDIGITNKNIDRKRRIVLQLAARKTSVSTLPVTSASLSSKSHGSLADILAR
ncbi:hypothetical protein VTN77DRAFT_8989 [Rasamsonia byssochlamydoides]|uniref:uncharacterized protein n=1 Tax=Rasamsonia byssochlamydoides TaxID=89139 RepID=UPI003744539E